MPIVEAKGWGFSLHCIVWSWKGAMISMYKAIPDATCEEAQLSRFHI
jgi:hypothetical protein